MAKHPVPDEVQAKRLLENGINPQGVFVINDGGDYLLVQNYKTGDTIRIEENFEKKNRREMGW